MTKTYFKGANAILLTYDITSLVSFRNTEKWLEHIRNNTDNIDLVLILVGNKIDLSGARQVTSEMGKQLAEKNEIRLFIETSAKDDVNIEKCFDMIIDSLFSNSSSTSTSLPVVENIKLMDVSNKKKKCC
jgi:small GTP-binding protein